MLASSEYGSRTPRTITAIPLPDKLTPGKARRMADCGYCIVKLLCKADVGDGLPAHCEATAEVLVGGRVVTL